MSTEDDNCSPKYEIELDSLTLPFQINFKALDSENKVNEFRGQRNHSYASVDNYKFGAPILTLLLKDDKYYDKATWLKVVDSQENLYQNHSFS